MFLNLIFISLSLVIVYLDFSTKKVPRFLSVLLLLGVCLLKQIKYIQINNYIYSILAFLLQIIFAYLLLNFVRKITNSKLGYADVLYGTSMVVYLGFYKWIYATLISCLLGLLVFVLFFIIKRSSKKEIIKFISIPFIPCLFLGTLFMQLLCIFIHL